MADIPRRNYALAHMNEVQLITGITDWLSFLDRKDRLVYLMELAQPVGKVDQTKCDKFFSSYCDWSFLGRLEWCGLWVDKTPQEDWLFRQIAILNKDWWELGGYFDHESEQALAVLARYQRLIELAKILGN
tara:strand:- start:81 stop:473 length:393 start_codon:yes stop_codon:yes gene_type:complete